MDKKKNKENSDSNTTKKMQLISKAFKVKKSLFASPTLVLNSVKAESPLFSNSSNVRDEEDESPYALFQIHKKRRAMKTGWKQSSKVVDDTPLKRYLVQGTPTAKMDTTTESGEDSNSIKLALQKSFADGNLTGDFSKACCLPTIKGSHPDLKTITPHTVAELLQGEESQIFSIIDCRYPYEFHGGHIKNATNLYHKDDAERDFFSSSAMEKTKRSNLIFYCEFSSQRAPSMIRFIRNRDRDLNEYPVLYYPELYLVEGGYKAFHENFKELCEPQEYQTMLDKNFSQEFVFYRAICKSWSVKSKRGKKARSALKFESPATPQQQ